jgi:hypothetical protein
MTDGPFDPTSTELRPLAEYTDRIRSRRRCRKLNRATLWRWAMRGARGGKIRLETLLIGGGRFTSDAAVAAFMQALSQPEAPSAAATAPHIGDEEVARIQGHFQ